MATTKKFLQAAAGVGGGADFLAVEDVFSTFLYTGNGSTQTITNGIDLAGEGGLVWIKNRGLARNHALFDTARGVYELLSSNLTNAETEDTSTLSSFNADGFSVDNRVTVGGSGEDYASWTFRKAPRFFDVVTYTGTGSSGNVINHNLGTTVGTIILKRTDTAADWVVWNRTFTGSEYLFLNSTSALFDDSPVVNFNNVTDTSFQIDSTWASTNASGGTYVAYLFAHDPLGPSGDGSDGLIACGSYAGADHRSGELVDLGWEPQWVLIKNATDTSALGDTDWVIVDTMRGMSHTSEAFLYANLSSAESASTADIVAPDPQGFRFIGADRDINRDGDTYIYIAIRRGPMRVPESGTEVFDAVTYTGTLTAANPNNRMLEATDLWFNNNRTGGRQYVLDRLRGWEFLVTDLSNAEATSFDWSQTDQTTLNPNADWWTSSVSQVDYYFRRAPNFFDAVAYTGNGVAGRTVPHNLGVAPEMMIVKSRTSAETWAVYHDAIGNTQRLVLNGTNTPLAGQWNSTSPDAVNFTLSSDGLVNGSGQNYIAYLFATLDGVSKVGSYTGNGSSQTIDCGFTSGARFLIIKRTDDNGGWYVWDTARGIVTGNDPFLELNTNDAEVTTDDSIDPDSSGFIVNQTATTNVNVSSAAYIFYAIA